MLENEDTATALARGDGSHETRCPGTEHQDIANLIVMG
jgi:hypothetical protein